MRSSRLLAALTLSALAVPCVASVAEAGTLAGSSTQTLTGTVDVVVVDGGQPDGNETAGTSSGITVRVGAAAHAQDDAKLVTRTLVQVGGRLLDVPPALSAGLRSGQRVSVTVRSKRTRASASVASAGTLPGAGSVAAQDFAVTSLRPVGTRLAATLRAAAVSPLGTHTLTVLPVYWNTPDGQTVASLTSLANDTATYWSEQSGGKIVIAPTVKDWQKITDPGSCDVSTLFDRALAANGLSAPTSLTQHVLIYFPQRSDCAWAGLGSITGSRIWDNGYSLTDVTAHEFGHNLGLGHANRATCTASGGTGRVSLSGSCTIAEYNDAADVMGYATYARTGNLNTALADWLGLAQTVTATTTAPATVELAPLAQVGAVRSVKVNVGTGTVYVDFRPATGRDVRRPDWAGVQVHYLPLGSYPQSQLLDMQPTQAAAFTGTSLPTWSVWPVPGAGVSVTVQSVGATATVRVVPTAGDATPPSSPVVSATVPSATPTALTAAWTAATDAGTGIAAYAVYVDDVLAARTGPDARQVALTVSSSARTVRVEAVDGAGNTARSGSATITVGSTTSSGTGTGTGTATGTGTGTGTGSGTGSGTDTTPPSAPVVTAPVTASVVSTRTVRWAWNAATDAESGISGYRLYGNGTALTGLLPATTGSVTATLPEGTTTLGVVAVNGATLSGKSAEVSVTVDSLAPTAPTALQVDATTGVLSWTAPRDTGTSLSYLVALDGGTAVSATSTKAPAATPVGRHTWSVRAVDRAGNTSPAATLAATFDPTPPSAPVLIPVTSPDAASAGILPKRSVTVSWTAATDAETGVVGYRVYVNGTQAATASNTPTSTLLTLPEGASTVAVRAVNGAGMLGEASTLPFLVDSSAPSAPVVLTPAGSIVTGPATVTWRAAADAQTGITKYVVLVDNVSVGTAAGTATSFALPNALPTGRTSRVTVAAVNGAGTRTVSGAVAVTVVAKTKATPRPVTKARPRAALAAV